jgi:SAM-dependent methyltransferase
VTDTVSEKTPFQFGHAAAIIRHVQKTEAQYLLHGNRSDPQVTPWMPFQPAEFLSIVFECVPEMQGREFLDVGCGPGTKMLLARHFYGMGINGIEIDPVMAGEARRYGPVWAADALEMASDIYPAYDLIWLYRPFRDQALEQRLETRIMDEMKPGAILAGGGWETCPADHRWITVVDDWELRRGAWMKPRPVTDLKL